jgi:hypothetical protein
MSKQVGDPFQLVDTSWHLRPPWMFPNSSCIEISSAWWFQPSPLKNHGDDMELVSQNDFSIPN